VLIACDLPNYGHQAIVSEASRAELAKDLA
jgi:hypothetical protein